MPEPSTQCVKLVRVWRPLVSDFDMVDISPCATVGSLKARFKDFTPPSAVESRRRLGRHHENHTRARLTRTTPRAQSV